MDSDTHVMESFDRTNRIGLTRLRTFTVLGMKVRAHNAGCAQSFREDRKVGLIYGQVCDADDHSKVYGWGQGSRELDFCVYCG